MKYVSLYSGIGGLDYGFNYLKYELKFANDFHVDSCKTFSKYFVTDFEYCLIIFK